MRFDIAVGCVLTVCGWAAGAVEIAPIVLDGPEAVGKVTVQQAKVQWAGGGMRVEFGKGEWPHVKFAAGKAFETTDWSGVGRIVFDVRNPGTEPLTVHVRADAVAEGVKYVRQGHATIGAGERVKIVWTGQAAPEGMRAGPMPEVSARTMTCSGKWPEKATGREFQIFLARPEKPAALEVFSVGWAAKAELKGIVDRFGQYARAQWPGKVHTEEDLAKAMKEEEAWLRETPALAERDEYGGWAAGPRLKGTGFFRAEKREGRWWLVTPKGNLFWSVGTTCVRRESSGPIRGRESMFTWLPEWSVQRGWVDFYALNLSRKYGEAWKQRWAERTCERLPAWGFNTIANWSDESVCQMHRVPFTATIHFGGLPPIGAKPEEGTDRRLMDFFDESFPQKAEEAIAKVTARWRDDAWCVGYYVHNELHWDSWSQKGSEGVVARGVLASSPTLAARRVLVKMLKEKYGSVEAFAKAWGVGMADWDQQITLSAAQLNEAAKADCSLFLTAMAERYFSVVGAAMKKHAPNQLYLGCRFAIRPKEVVDVSAKYCDVVSFNIYHDTIDPVTWGLLNELGKPVIIGEFHFGATDRGMFHAGLRPTASQAERAKAYAAYVKSAAAMPAIVGCHWFQYVDQPLTGRFDGENYNIGFVSIVDTPYPELRAAAREVNERVYRMHGEGK